jgi:hypothetical protein
MAIGPVILLAVLGSSDALATPTDNGTDVVFQAACVDPETGLATATCYRLLIRCGPSVGISRYLDTDTTPDLEIRERMPAGAAAGAVLFFSGENGDQYYDIPATHAWAGGTVSALKAAGYQTYEVRWLNENGTNFGDGWLSGAGGYGPKLATCGAREIIEWVKENKAPTVSLCATGNSFGGVQIAYAVAAHGAGPYLKSAVYSAGPSVADIPRGCFLPTYDNGVLPGHTRSLTAGFHVGALRSTIIDPLMGWTDAASNCGTDASHPDLTSAYNTADAQAMALVSYGPSAEARDYAPPTRQFFVEASLDATGATVQGGLYQNAISGFWAARVITQANQDDPASADFLAHTVHNTETGSRVIREFLLDPCNCQ